MNANTCCGSTKTCSTPSTLEHPETAHKGVSYFKPNVDVLEKDGVYIVRADIPGAKAESIAIDYDNGSLTVTAHVEPRRISGTRTLASEYGVGDYRRVFRVGESIDTSRIQAEYKDGVLHISLPKAEAAKPRKVLVNSTGS